MKEAEMDYRRLSRESLIHEIEQLNLKIERTKLREIGLQMGIKDCLNDIDSPAFIVSYDYNVLWANSYCSSNFQQILHQKCYQVFFGFDDICSGCKMHFSVDTKSFSSNKTYKIFDGKTQIYENTFFPLNREQSTWGVLEIINKSSEDVNQKENLFESIQLLKQDNFDLIRKNNNLNTLIEQFTKALRIPLRSFKGYFQILNNNKNVNESLKKEYLDILKNSSEILYETFNKLLIYTKHDGGNKKTKREEFNINQLFEDTIRQSLLYNASLYVNNITIEYAPTIPEVLIGDELNLKLIISYLLELVQHISNNKPIEIKVSEISQSHKKMDLKFSMNTSNEMYSGKIKVLDYFDFRKNTELNSIEDYSLGLGLHLAQKLIDEIGGSLELSGGLDKTFNVNVILSLDKVIPRTQVKDVDTDRQKKRLLIADFEKPIISMDIFEGYDVYFAQTGNEAIDLYFKLEPDLMLINVLIEDCDGFMVFDEIERRRKKPKPIVAISNKLVDNEREFMRDYGFDDYYPKPINSETIIHIVKSYL